MEESNDPPQPRPPRNINIHMPVMPIIPNLFMTPNMFMTMGLHNSFDDDIPDKPAEKEFINSLQEIKVDQDMFDKELQCSICLDRFEIDETCIKLPCENPHFFHTGNNKEVCEGIKPWFELNHNCPVCRHNFPEKQDDPSEATSPNDEQPETTHETNPVENDQRIETLLMNRFNQLLQENPIDHIFDPPLQMNSYIDRVIDREEDRQLQEAIRLSLDDS